MSKLRFTTVGLTMEFEDLKDMARWIETLAKSERKSEILAKTRYSKEYHRGAAGSYARLAEILSKLETAHD